MMIEMRSIALPTWELTGRTRDHRSARAIVRARTKGEAIEIAARAAGSVTWIDARKEGV